MALIKLGNLEDTSDVISFEAPRPFTAVAFTGNGILLTGGEDGSIRIFDLSPGAPRVLRKAIQGLPDEVTCICTQQGGDTNTLGKTWAACGKQAFLFNLDSDKLVMKSEEAEDIVTLIEESEGSEDDVLNQISVSKDLMAYSCDSGAVGVLNTQTKNRKVMRAAHANICGAVVFVPIRPRESKGFYSVVSGGYDSQFIHFDSTLGTVLSRLDVPALPPTNDSPISLSPPFLLSVAISSDGILAAATADGRVIVGRAGERGRGDNRPNKRKWNGLNADMVDQYHIAEGPVVGISWVAPSELLTVSLGGQVKHLRLPEPSKGSPASGGIELQQLWAGQTRRVHKVNSLAALAIPGHVLHIAVAGLMSTGRGCVEIWKRRLKDSPAT